MDFPENRIFRAQTGQAPSNQHKLVIILGQGLWMQETFSEEADDSKEFACDGLDNGRLGKGGNSSQGESRDKQGPGHKMTLCDANQKKKFQNLVCKSL